MGDSTQVKHRRLGWKGSLGDHRDFYRASGGIHLPPHTSWRTAPFQPAVYDQGDLGSCTANGSGSLAELVLRKEHQTNPLVEVFTPSRLGIYYGEREMEHSIGYDSGAYIRDALKVIAKQGVYPETMWPYDISKYRDRPSAACYQEGLRHIATKYERVQQTLQGIKGALAQGHCIVFGFVVHSNFMDDGVTNSGIVPMPSGPVEGGHCAKITGYNDLTHKFEMKNSWGTSWGQQGYCYLPYAFLLDPSISSDLWTIEAIS